MASNINVAITADVTDLVAKKAIMSAELKAATADLNAFAREAAASGGGTKELSAGMLAAAEAATKARAQIAGVNVQLKELQATSRTPGIAGQFKDIAEGVHGAREAVIAFGEAMTAAFAVREIAEFAEKLGKSAEEVKHLSETFGLAVPQLQGLKAAATATGVSFDSITRGIGIFDKNLINANASNNNAAKALAALGISAKQGKDQMELLLEVADKFGHMEDGPKKVALAMNLFGKAGKDLIPFLDQGREGLERLDQKGQEYAAGVLIATEANKGLRDWLDQVNERGVALAESLNEQKVGWQGISNVLTDAFAPMLKEVADGLNTLIREFIESYREGGTVAQIFEVIRAAGEVLGTIFEIMGTQIKAMWEIASSVFEAMGQLATTTGDIVALGLGQKISDTSKQSVNLLGHIELAFFTLKEAVAVVCAVIEGALTDAMDHLRLFAKVADDALHANWGAIEADWKSGLAAITADVDNAAAKIVKAGQEMRKAMFLVQQGSSPNASTWWSGAGGTGLPEPKGPKDFDPPLPTGKGKHPKAKDDLVQRLEEELQAKKLAWSLEQDAQGTAQAYSLQSESDYWKQFLSRTDLSVKDRLAIETKYLAAHQQLTKQKLTIEEDGFKAQMAAANKDAGAKLAIAETELAWTKRIYGEQSTQYSAMQARIVQITKEAENQRVQIEADHEKAVEQLHLGQISAEQQAAQHRVAMGRETNAQLIAEERRFEDEKWAIEKAALLREQALATANNDPAKAAQIHNQLIAAEQAYQNRLTKIVQQAELERTKYQRQGIQGVSSAFGQSIGQMLTLQKSFADGVKGIWQGVQQTIGNILGDIIQQWLEKQLTALILGKAQQTTAGVGQIAANAAVAGSGAYAATAMIPFVGPELAPAAAATAYAGALAFEGLLAGAGFAKGIDDVPQDMIAKIHAGERILPAADNAKLTRLVEAGANDNGGSTRGGDTNNHSWEYHDHTGTATPDLIEKNHRAIAKGWKRAYREGHFAGMKL